MKCGKWEITLPFWFSVTIVSTLQKMDFFNNGFCSICEEILHLPQKISALFIFTKITLEEAFSEPCQVSKMERFLKIVFGR